MSAESERDAVKAAYQAAIDAQAAEIITLKTNLRVKQEEIDALKASILANWPGDVAHIQADLVNVRGELNQLRIKLETLQKGSERTLMARGEVELENQRLNTLIERKRLEAASTWELHNKQFAEQVKLLKECLQFIDAMRNKPNIAAFLARPDVQVYL